MIDTVRSPVELKPVEFDCQNPLCKAGLRGTQRDGMVIDGGSRGVRVAFTCPHCRWNVMVEGKLFEVEP